MPSTEKMDIPFPVPSADSAGFWNNATAGRLAIQQCEKCLAYQFPPLETCPLCHGKLHWIPLSGRGEVYSFIVQHHAISAVFASQCPYAIALVSPEEAPHIRIPGRIEGDPTSIKIGNKVQTRMSCVNNNQSCFPVYIRQKDGHPQ